MENSEKCIIADLQIGALKKTNTELQDFNFINETLLLYHILKRNEPNNEYLSNELILKTFKRRNVRLLMKSTCIDEEGSVFKRLQRIIEIQYNSYLFNECHIFSCRSTSLLIRNDSFHEKSIESCSFNKKFFIDRCARSQISLKSNKRGNGRTYQSQQNEKILKFITTPLTKTLEKVDKNKITEEILYSNSEILNCKQVLPKKATLESRTKELAIKTTDDENVNLFLQSCPVQGAQEYKQVNDQSNNLVEKELNFSKISQVNIVGDKLNNNKVNEDFIRTQQNVDYEQDSNLKQSQNELAVAVYKQKEIISDWKRKFHQLNIDNKVIFQAEDSYSPQKKSVNQKIQPLTNKAHVKNDTEMKAYGASKVILFENHDQNTSLKLELERKDVGLSSLMHFLNPMFHSNSGTLCVQLKKPIAQLENKVKDQKDEIDDLNDQVKYLEGTKRHLYMNINKIHSDYSKQLLEKDEELEELRVNSIKKIKYLESQLEYEHNDHIKTLQQKHDLKGRLNEIEEKLNNIESLHENVEKYKHNLKITQTLLEDERLANKYSHDKYSCDKYSKALIQTLRDQLEESECARTAAVKCRLKAEAEAIEAIFAMDKAIKAQTSLEAKLAAVTNHWSQTQTQLEENEEELSQVLRKYENTVLQLSIEKALLQEHAEQIGSLKKEVTELHDELAETRYKLENLQNLNEDLSSDTIRVLTIKIKDLETKADLEKILKSRLNIQVSRLKETTQKLQNEIKDYQEREHSSQDLLHKIKKDLKSTNEERLLLLRKEVDYNSKCKDLERRLKVSEYENFSLKRDLKLALERIQKLKMALENEAERGVESCKELVNYSYIQELKDRNSTMLLKIIAKQLLND